MQDVCNVMGKTMKCIQILVSFGYNFTLDNFTLDIFNEHSPNPSFARSQSNLSIFKSIFHQFSCHQSRPSGFPSINVHSRKNNELIVKKRRKKKSFAQSKKRKRQEISRWLSLHAHKKSPPVSLHYIFFSFPRLNQFSLAPLFVFLFSLRRRARDKNWKQ